MECTLRNRLHATDTIRGATIQFLDPVTRAVRLTATTNRIGVASLDLKTLPSGTYTCVIMAPNTFADPVGPALLASAGAVPERVYRPVTLTIVRTMRGITSATPSNPQHATVVLAGNHMNVDIQPVWMRSSMSSNRGQAITMIVVHHTACALGPAVNTFLAEKGPHYMIAPDGQIVKWVQDARSAWHAGSARWSGYSDVNARSIGIEIVHTTGAYPAAQYTALLELLGRIRTAFSTINAWDIVGHSDVGTNAGGRLGRKSGDPGAQFEWSRLEDRGLGMQMIIGPPSLNIYAGFFQAVPTGALRHGDNDSHHRFGASVRPAITGTPVRELQDDLALIGYSVGTPNGVFGEDAQHAVIAFQEHFFAGGRGHKTPDGRVDFQTAAMIKSVASWQAIQTVIAAGVGGAPAATGAAPVGATP